MNHRTPPTTLGFRSISTIVIAAALLGTTSLSIAGNTTNVTFDCFPKTVSQQMNSVEVSCFRNADALTPGQISLFSVENSASAAEPFLHLAQTARLNGALLVLTYRADGSQNGASCPTGSCRTPHAFAVKADRAMVCPVFNPFTTNTTTRDDFCKTAGCPCHMLEGDCDNDAECANGLKCRMDVGPAVRMTSTTDLCYPSSCPVFNASTPSTTFCTPGCPCYINEGNCTNDDQCLGSLICVPNSGAGAGLPANYGTCQKCPAFNPSSPNNFCNERCPCGPGEGDCSDPVLGGPSVPDDAECLPTLSCRKDSGAAYGMAAGVDVCVPRWLP
jgi:hypothetical protein